MLLAESRGRAGPVSRRQGAPSLWGWPRGPHLQLGRLRLQCGVMLLQEGALLLQRQDLAAEGRVLGLQVLQLFLEQLLLSLQGRILGEGKAWDRSDASSVPASLVAQLVKNPSAMRHTWVGKIPWRKERLPTPVLWPGEFHGLYVVHGVVKSWTHLSDFHFTSSVLLTGGRDLSCWEWEPSRVNVFGAKGGTHQVREVTLSLLERQQNQKKKFLSMFS